MTDNEENRTAIIPDFFVEFIGRVIPGLVFIALFLYWSDRDFVPIFSSVGLSLFVLTGAWIVGITLDTGIFCVVNLLRFKRPKMTSPEHDQFWDFVRKAKAWEREALFKQHAQKIFFRGMMSNGAITTVICIVMEFTRKLDLLLPRLLFHNRVYGIVAFACCLVFGLCWQAQSKALEEDWSLRYKSAVKEWTKTRDKVTHEGH